MLRGLRRWVVIGLSRGSEGIFVFFSGVLRGGSMSGGGWTD